jgi:hypothetical protein
MGHTLVDQEPLGWVEKAAAGTGKLTMLMLLVKVLLTSVVVAVVGSFPTVSAGLAGLALSSFDTSSNSGSHTS